MADHLFENQTITSEGLNLIAHATAADAIVYTKALSNATVPADPSNVSSYSGKVGTIASASSSGNAARITLAFENSDTTSSQAVKCIALMGRLQSESGDGVIVAYCSSGESSITLPSSSDAPCVTRFVVNLVMSSGSDSTINVVESGGASLSDLSRFVSTHKVGSSEGEAQTIRGAKTFTDQATFDVKVIATNGVAAQGLSRFPKIISNYLEARDGQDQTIFNLNVSDNGASIVSSVPLTIGAGNNVLLLVSSNGVYIDGRLLPVQKYSYLGDSDHVWHYAHINELTAEEVSATTYLKAATQIKATTTYGIYLTDSSGAILSNVYPTDLSKIVANSAYELVGDDRRVRTGEICYLDLTRGLNDVKNMSFTIPRGMTVGNGVVFYDSASSNTFNIRVLRQGNEVLLSNTARFVILSSAVMPAVGASQTADNVRTTVLAACVSGD